MSESDERIPYEKGEKRKKEVPFEIPKPSYHCLRPKYDFAEDYDFEYYSYDPSTDPSLQYSEEYYGPVVLEPVDLPPGVPRSIPELHAIVFKESLPIEVEQLCSLERCEACMVGFTSPSDSKQHYFGNSHRKAIAIVTTNYGYCAPTPRFKTIPLEYILGTKPEVAKNLKLHCDICNIGLQTEANAALHYSGKGHAKRARKGPSQSEMYEEASTITFDLSSEIENGERPSKKPKNAYCMPCKMDFSSVEQYDKHLDSNEHQANCSVDRKGRKGKADPISAKEPVPYMETMLSQIRNAAGPYHCAICDVSATGEQGYRMHLEGKAHRRKMQLVGTSSQSADHEQEFKCDLCSVVCSSEAGLEAHNAGKKHIKKMMSA